MTAGRRMSTWVAAAAALVLILNAGVIEAQTLAGVVKDASGAVLPGVTVEASSPALIERTRSVVTDGQGQYQIVNLRPGTYAVTFTLGGFAKVVRQGLEVTGGGVVTVNVDMRVSGVEESITVTGAAPTVDLQTSVKREQVLQFLEQAKELIVRIARSA